MNINDIKYGHPVKQALNDFDNAQEMGLTPRALEMLVRLIPPVPANDSKETNEELEYLYELQEVERPFMERLIEKADDDLPSVFFDMCAEWQIEAYEDEALEHIKGWGALSGVLKIYFNRARPFQLAPYHKVPLFPMASISAWTASYPSGHTMQAEALSRFYAQKYPELSDEFDNVAKAISHTRLVGGYHFPSDILASETLVDLLWGKVL